jgi:hypothetical protein
VGEVKDLVTVATQTPSRITEHKLVIDDDSTPPVPYTVEVYWRVPDTESIRF